MVLADFPSEWADPTRRIIRALLMALGVVVAFPYLPASSSPAFTGVSVFLGILLSLASSSALSNIIAGLVLTYTRAFRLGDRVQIGDTYGDIVDMSTLVTKVRTIRNEEVTIPNGVVLGNSVTNYTRQAKTLGLILHTRVTIGYDVPWRTVHGLLVDAALATPGVLPDPRPFVWQTSLNDFYVTYEINASTGSPHDAPAIYADLHSRIQDAFFAAGVESCRRTTRRCVTATPSPSLRSRGRRGIARAPSGSERHRPPAARPADGAAPGSPRPGFASQKRGLQDPFPRPASAAVCR